MGSAPVVTAGLPYPRGWLFLALFGVWLYLVSQLLRLVPDRFADAFVLTIPDAKEVLAITSGLGQILFFAGLVAALSRVNRAAGYSSSAFRGIVLGASGVGVLVVFEAALLPDWVGVPLGPVNPLLAALDPGVIAGTALSFAGLASLSVGFAQTAGMFRRKEREVSDTASRPEKTS